MVSDDERRIVMVAAGLQASSRRVVVARPGEQTRGQIK